MEPINSYIERKVVPKLQLIKKMKLNTSLFKYLILLLN